MPNPQRKWKRRQRKKTRLETPNPQEKTRSNSPPTRITIEIGLPSTRIAQTVYSSLLPETMQPAGFRSRTVVRREGRFLRLMIEAQDIVALRAASNTFLRFVSVALKTLNVIAPFYSEADPPRRRNTWGQ